MRIIFLIFALAAIPIVFLTMFSRTSQGIKLKLGSFFILKKFRSDYLKVRSLKDISLLLLRLCFAALIVLLVIDPSDVEAPGRNAISHDPERSGQVAGDEYTFRLIAPEQAIDRYDEDRFFLDSFVKEYAAGSKSISVVYDPSEVMIESIKNDIIIFPSRRQAGSAFLKWIEILDFSPLRVSDSKIRDTDIAVKACYPILIKNSAVVKKYSELENGTVIAVSFENRGRRILLFGAGLSGFWGDIGVSGYFMDIIGNFIRNVSLSEKAEGNLQSKGNPGAGKVTGMLSFDIILRIASVIFLIELTVFSVKSARSGKAVLLIFLLLIPCKLFAGDFKFIELSLDGRPGRSRQLFSIIKHELEEKTSVRVSPDFYKTYSADLLIKGNFPELPYLWITRCSPSGLTQQLASALSDFIDKGGIIFADLTGKDTSCVQFFKALGLKISGNGSVRLPQDHPVFRSFYLIYNENLSGVDVSISTRRTALIISESNLTSRILSNSGMAVKSGVNIVLYMLSGNYKSDQIHTRQILNRLKKRELFR